MSVALADFPEEQVCAAGLVGPLRLEDVLFVADKANRIGCLQVVRADRVLGTDHLRSAAAHAHRAFAQGRNQADRLEVEFTRYLSGERQIRLALAKMGIEDGAPEAVVVGLGPKRSDAVRYFLHASGARTDAAILEPDPGRMASFGITQAQLDATTPERRGDLVLEAVAAVDLLR